MRRWVVSLCLGLCLFGGLSACRQPDLLFSKTEPLTLEQTRFYVAVGGSFEIVLPSLGSGSLYRWAIKSFEPDSLEWVKERPARSEYPENRYPPGYTPNTVFEFKGLKVGEWTVTFYQQPVSPETPPVNIERVFRVSVSRSLAAAFSAVPASALP